MRLFKQRTLGHKTTILANDAVCFGFVAPRGVLVYVYLVAYFTV